MEPILASPTAQELLTVVAVVIGLLLALVVLRFVLRLAARVVAVGCGLIIVVAICLLAYYFLG